MDKQNPNQQQQGTKPAPTNNPMQNKPGQSSQQGGQKAGSGNKK